jgi:hypothetical protein
LPDAYWQNLDMLLDDWFAAVLKHVMTCVRSIWSRLSNNLIDVIVLVCLVIETLKTNTVGTQYDVLCFVYAWYLDLCRI